MAIRCSELRLPAAIGCGEQRFESYSKKSSIQIDCNAGTIHIVGQ